MQTRSPPPKDSVVHNWSAAESLNFLLTNRLPRRWLTLAFGRFSRIRSRWLTNVTIEIWKRFVDDLRLFEAEQQTFSSLHECFTRRLKPGARPVDPDPDVLCCPSDGVVGAMGRVVAGRVYQAKGFPYSLGELIPDADQASRYLNGSFITLRLKSSMYHRFHAPMPGRCRQVTYISGDTWNVNPIALKRVEKLFCKNERAVLELTASDHRRVLLVPVAAILVASMHVHGLEDTLDLRYRGPNVLFMDRRYKKGEEMGFFQHGSTIVLFYPGELAWANGIEEGQTVRMGQPLARMPATCC